MLLGLAICLAGGVIAQFYDGPNDIYYYLLESENGKTVSKSNQRVYIFNFDGRKAAMLNLTPIDRHKELKSKIYDITP